jgi:hypothetical protein
LTSELFRMRASRLRNWSPRFTCSIQKIESKRFPKICAGTWWMSNKGVCRRYIEKVGINLPVHDFWRSFVVGGSLSVCSNWSDECSFMFRQADSVFTSSISQNTRGGGQVLFPNNVKDQGEGRKQVTTPLFPLWRRIAILTHFSSPQRSVTINSFHFSFLIFQFLVHFRDTFRLWCADTSLWFTLHQDMHNMKSRYQWSQMTIINTDSTRESRKDRIEIAVNNYGDRDQVNMNWNARKYDQFGRDRCSRRRRCFSWLSSW